MRAALHAWAAAESVLARAAHRRIRFCVNDLGSPPLTLSWGASHQDVRFPGEPLVPNPFVYGVNEAADEGCAGTFPELGDAARSVGKVVSSVVLRLWPIVVLQPARRSSCAVE